MFGGEFLTSFVPEVGVQEQMREHGKDPLWKIKYEQHNLLLHKILFSVGNLSSCRENVLDSLLSGSIGLSSGSGLGHCVVFLGA